MPLTCISYSDAAKLKTVVKMIILIAKTATTTATTAAAASAVPAELQHEQ